MAAYASAIPAAAQQGPSLAVVFDGSGSMWGKTTGRNGVKYQVARDGLLEGLAKAGQPAQLGVFGFGYRRRAACNRIETISPLAAPDLTDLKSRLDRFNPQGRGPIAEAMRVAGEAIKAAPAPRRMIVIHDGPDNCRADPCATAAELRRDMPDLVIHAMTLVEAGAPSVYSCFADQTGGRVIQLLDRDQIGPSLVQLTALALGGAAPRLAGSADAGKKPGTETAAAAPGALATSQTLPSGITDREGPESIVLAANLAKAGPLISAPIRWTIKREGGRDAPKSVVSSGVATVSLAPGSYTVTGAAGLVTVSEKVEVKSGRQTIFAANLKAGAIDFQTTLATSRSAIAGTTLTLRAVDGDGKPTEPPIYVGLVDDPVMMLPAATYFATATRGSLAETIRLDVAAGANQVVAFELPGAELMVALASARNEPVLIRVLERRGDTAETATFDEVARTTATTPSFQLPDGVYRLIARQGDAEVARDVTLARGETRTVSLSLRTGVAQLSTDFGGAGSPDSVAGISYRVWRENEAQDTARILFGARHELRLPPGRYVVQSRVAEPQSRATVTMVIAPDQTTNAVVTHGVGRLNLRLRSSAASRGATFWEVLNENGRRVWRGNGLETVALVPPGRYTVRAWPVGGDAIAGTADVATGGVTTTTLDARQ
ncbi:MAG: vWA domain-containing protein [Pseudomonadota bacterium]